jgi:hypothetical protein
MEMRTIAERMIASNAQKNPSDSFRSSDRKYDE